MSTAASTATITPSSIRLADACATFPDGSQVDLEEHEEVAFAQRTAATIRDTMWHTLVVSMSWDNPASGIVALPEKVVVEDQAGEDHEDRDYDRVVMIDNAIATLERARALLLAQKGATA